MNFNKLRHINRIKIVACTILAIQLFSPKIVSAGFLKKLNLKETEIHFEAAQKFEYQGDVQSAKEKYHKALYTARLAKADKSILSMLAYNYGRMAGYTCDYEDATNALTHAYELESEVSGPESGITSMRLFELARLNAGNGYYKKSVDYYNEALPIVEKLDIEKSDPIGFAIVLEQFADILKLDNQMDKANDVLQRAKDLRDVNLGKKPGIEPILYKCEK